jgi:hypothetical protein
MSNVSLLISIFPSLGAVFSSLGIFLFALGSAYAAEEMAIAYNRKKFKQRLYYTSCTLIAIGIAFQIVWIIIHLQGDI